jgi:hypothetical protein
MHKDVRRVVIEFFKDEKNQDETFLEYKNLCERAKIEHREKLRSPDTKFTRWELQALAHAYNHRIIVFSPINLMACFDCLYKAKTFEGNKKDPLYLFHHKGDYYQYLIQNDQSQI